MCMLTLLGAASCGGGGKPSTKPVTATPAATESHPLPDTLRVATLYSPGSYFLYRDTHMGYDYDLVTTLGRDKNMTIDLRVAPSLASAVAMLDSGQVDLIAYEVPVTAEYRRHALPCGPENVTSQVLVQPSGKNRITDVTQLAGRDVYVEKDSKYQHRLANLNNEIGGGIKIHPISRDSMITEDLIDLVARDSIPLTIVDSDIARVNRTYYPGLDVSLPVSFLQRSQWAVSPHTPWLADSIDAWLGQEQPRQAQARLLKRYFELSRASMPEAINFNFAGGRISRLDPLFKRHAKSIGWDWRLLAAQGYTESRLDSTVVSWAGARGIMQIMPKTARAFGLNESEITNNNRSIETAAKILKHLDKVFRSKVHDPAERRKFVIAAYNSGPAHILDAIALASKHGLNPSVWDANVAEALKMKSKPEYYNDPVCRYGYFHARQTLDYVERVYNFYTRACRAVKM